MGTYIRPFVYLFSFQIFFVFKNRMTRFFAAPLQRQLSHFVKKVVAQIRERIDSLEVRSTMHEQMSNLKRYNAYKKRRKVGKEEMNQGRKEGRKEGRMEGRKEGREEGRKER